MTEHVDSQLRMQRKFANFWSNVTRVDASKIDVSTLQGINTLSSIVEGMRSVEPDKHRESR